MSRREFVLVLCALATVYLPLSLLPAPDLRIFLFPWLHHIQSFGPIGAFAHPFSNYSPPYLYLLAAFSTFGLPDIATIKLLSIVGASWLAFCVAVLARTLGKDPLPAFLLTLALPTAIMNSAALGQCDTFWAGCCVLAINSAIREEPYAMAAWAGAGFAFKAQSAFLAPVCVGYLIQRRQWIPFAIPPAIYLVAIAPAALAGWPLLDLLTVYLRQPQFSFIGDAPNFWAVAYATGVPGPTIFPFGYMMGLIAAVAIMFVRPRSVLSLALLAAIALPFLLPKMLERYFFLADVLALVCAYVERDRRSIATAALIQCGSFLSIIAYLLSLPLLDAVASVTILCGLFLVLHAAVEADDGPVDEGVGRRKYVDLSNGTRAAPKQ